MDTAMNKDMKNTEVHKYMRNMEPCTKHDEEHGHCGAQNMTIIDNDVRKIMGSWSLR
jgi:hypothetical protein